MQVQTTMRPQDVVILLKLLTWKGPEWQYRDLSASLFLRLSEVSQSLSRSNTAGLVDASRKKVNRQSLMEFIRNGLRYVFPETPGTLVTGIPTAHSHSFYRRSFVSDTQFVWPAPHIGMDRGLAIQPLYKNCAKAAMQDHELYLLLASIDILRVGKTREFRMALDQLQKHIL